MSSSDHGFRRNVSVSVLLNDATLYAASLFRNRHKKTVDGTFIAAGTAGIQKQLHPVAVAIT